MFTSGHGRQLAQLGRTLVCRSHDATDPARLPLHARTRSSHSDFSEPSQRTAQTFHLDKIGRCYPRFDCSIVGEL